MTVPLLSVLIPVWNEAATIRSVIDRVLAEPTEKEIVVVNDCSTDGTREILQAVSDPRVRVIHHETNKGKGAGIRTAVAAARGRYTIIQDADLELFPEEYPRLLAPLLDGSADAVMGVRALEEGREWPFKFWLANRIFSLSATIVAGQWIGDVMTCFKVMPTEVFQEIAPESNGFEMEPELVMKLVRRRARITQVPVTYAPRTVTQGKKIKFSDSFRVLPAVWRYGVSKR